MTQFNFSLDDPSYLLPHKIGILGLTKVLAYCDRLNLLQPSDISFSVHPRKLAVNWQCPDNVAFSILKNAAYQINDGLIDSPALELSDEERYFFSQGLLTTFFQHNTHRKFTGEPRELSFLVEDDKPPITPVIRPITECCYTQDIPKLFSKNGAFSPYITIKSHNFPGMIENEINPKKNLESVDKFLLLFFLPLVAPIVSLSPDLLGARRGLVLIEPYNLVIQKQHKTPRQFKQSIYSSYGDALLSFLANETTDIHQLNIELYILGTQQWNTKQRFIKKKVVRPKIKEDSLEMFKYFAQLLPTTVHVSPQKAFVSPSTLLGFIADNLIQEKQWHHNLGQFLLSNTYYEKKTLLSMIQSHGSIDYQKSLNYWQSLWQSYLFSKKIKYKNLYYHSIQTKAFYLLQSAKNQNAFIRNLLCLFPLNINEFFLLDKQWELVKDEIIQAIFLYNLPKSIKSETHEKE